MVDVAKVTMFGENVGTFRWDNTFDVARFEYDSQFIGKGIEPSPLMMPVQQGRIYSFGNLNREVFNGLPGMLADSLPDTYGRALFEQWLALTGRPCLFYVPTYALFLSFVFVICFFVSVFL